MPMTRQGSFRAKVSKATFKDGRKVEVLKQGIPDRSGLGFPKCHYVGSPLSCR